MHVFWFLLNLLISVLTSALPNGDFYHVKACCYYSGAEFENIEYTIVLDLNKHIIMQYNSTRGNWIGFTEYGVNDSKYWNEDPYDAKKRKLEKKLMCENNLKYIQMQRNLTTTPTIRIKSVKQPDGKHPAMLVCLGYEFYPKLIRLTWLRNGQEVTEGVTHSDVMSDGTLNYQVHSHLEYTPTPGETVTCMVEHVGLSEPTLIIWDPSLPVEKRLRIAVGLCALLSGLLMLSLGLIYYMKKSAAYNALHQGENNETNAPSETESEKPL